MGEPNTNNIRQSLDLIRSDRPEDRTRGIAMLSQMKYDPRVVQVFQLLYRDDPDPGVRAAARDALGQQETSVPVPAAVESPVAIQPSVAGTAQAVAVAPAAAARGPFLVDPANARVIARHTRYSRRRRQIIWATVGITLLLAGVFAGLALPNWWQWYQLREKGVTARAVITSLQERGNGRHVVTYRFTAGEPEDIDAPSYSGEFRTTLGEFVQLEEDDLIPVVYLPDDPSVSRLDLRSPDTTRRLRRSLAALALTLLAVFLILYDVQRRRATSTKRLIRGEVVSCSGHTDQDGSYHIKLRYRFSTPKGQPVSEQITRARYDLKNSYLPAAGTPLVIYYKGPRSYRVL